ncbi:nitroreductase family protein [Calidifontibacillus erzurumensis]|uniref:Nitroreductase family protein n=1 Tax=Calidifontibacillus erzurumensis TaxID=2741433 RepID=A0A8J8GDK6_9BACI|nr:nitroreductase family protein [Calidifontibacillus erzurumensis]NSL51417.1 nitroreductase family protein [Calidifontibacillus erzurumensis]
MEFVELAKSRRSAINFQSDVKITVSELQEIFEIVKTHPSSYNLQTTHYYVATSEEKKAQVKAASFNQHKTLSASATIIVCGDREGYKKAPDLYESMKLLGIIDECEYKETIETIKNLYENNPTLIEEDNIRNACLSAMLFMLAAKDKGWDTCPMHVKNVDLIKNIYNIPENHEPVLMITIGKSDEKIRPRGYRKPIGEFVHFVD